MYDYDARESDEVSFLDGDIIVNCLPIHEGWMSGMVERTGQCGLLPANYVESIIIWTLFIPQKQACSKDTRTFT